mmetsp:Transcript_20243/g.57692  ORF Transcript_20243/g.57692 Transcript_20243/m.57692 type:complete len:224 (-) Transcript_20243:511-1182(-)
MRGRRGGRGGLTDEREQLGGVQRRTMVAAQMRDVDLMRGGHVVLRDRAVVAEHEAQQTQHVVRLACGDVVLAEHLLAHGQDLAEHLHGLHALRLAQRGHLLGAGDARSGQVLVPDVHDLVKEGQLRLHAVLGLEDRGQVEVARGRHHVLRPVLEAQPVHVLGQVRGCLLVLALRRAQRAEGAMELRARGVAGIRRLEHNPVGETQVLLGRAEAALAQVALRQE